MLAQNLTHLPDNCCELHSKAFSILFYIIVCFQVDYIFFVGMVHTQHSSDTVQTMANFYHCSTYTTRIC